MSWDEGLTKFCRVEGFTNLRDVSPVEAAALHSSSTRGTLASVEHPAEGVARLEHCGQGTSDDLRVGVDEGEETRHVFEEKVRGHVRRESVDCC